MTRRKALRDLQMEAAQRVLKQVSEKHRRLLTEWQVRRIVTTAQLLNIPADQISPGHIWWCQALHDGEPSEPPPRIEDVQPDGRTRRTLRKLGLEIVGDGGPR